MICNNSLLKEPKISIIITYYNLENYVVDCIRSILNQSYKNFEIIIVNDGSDKKNSEILNNYVFNIYDKLPSIEERKEYFKKLTKEDIVNVSKKVKLNTIFTLEGR